MLRLILCSLVVLLCCLGASASPGELLALVSKGDLACKLTGDGSTTSKSSLSLANLTPQALTVSIPAGQVFVPQEADKNQYMMTTEPRSVQGNDPEKLPKRRTTTTTEWSRDAQGRRYKSGQSTTTEKLDSIDDNGMQQTSRTTTNTRYSGPNDSKGTTTRSEEVFDDRTRSWVPKPK